MTFQLQMEQLPGYLAARFVGSCASEKASQQLELIAEHCKLTNNKKLLIDMTGLELIVTFMDRFMGGKRLGIFARQGIKVALVGRPDQGDPRQFTLLVARNRGVTIEVFTNFQAAEEWLLK